MTDEATTLEVVVHDEGGCFRVKRVGILFDQRFRKIVNMFGQTSVEIVNDVQTVLRLFPGAARFVAEVACKSQSAQSYRGWSELDKLSIE